jgi:hypothetical protein
MPNLLEYLGKLTELDRGHIGFWLNGPEGGKIPSEVEVGFLDRAELKQAAQKYFDRWFTSYGKSASSSSEVVAEIWTGR